MTKKVHIVIWKPHRWNCFREESREASIEEIIENNYIVEKVFSTEDAAKQFIAEDAAKLVTGENPIHEASLEHVVERHYSIMTEEVQKSNHDNC